MPRPKYGHILFSRVESWAGVEWSFGVESWSLVLEWNRGEEFWSGVMEWNGFLKYKNIK